MAKEKSLFDKDGARKVMRKRDYAADFDGQMALGLMANLERRFAFCAVKKFV